MVRNRGRSRIGTRANSIAPTIRARNFSVRVAISLEGLLLHQVSDREQCGFRDGPARKKTFFLLNSYSTGSTYCCEAAFSVMNFIKCRYRARLTHNHLHQLMLLSLTGLEPGIKDLSKSKQAHPSH